MRTFLTRLTALLSLCSLVAQERALRIAPVPPPEASTSATFNWPTEHGPAALLARQRSSPRLLFFTASWCGPCKTMTRTTFTDPAVIAELGALIAVKLDVDLPDNRELFTSLGDGAVPGFALVDPDGNLVHRWSGAGDPAQFLAELATGRALCFDEGRRQRLVAEQALLAAVMAADEPAIVAANGRLVELGDPTVDGDLIENLRGLGKDCRSRRRWAELAGVAARLLASPSLADDLFAEAELWADAAEFELRGVVTERLAHRIDAWIEVLAEPFPGSSLASRLSRLIRGPDAAQVAAAHAWVDRVNGARDALSQLGEPARQPLLTAMKTCPEAAERCARTLGSMRLPGIAETVRRTLESEELSVQLRAAHVSCLASLKEPQARPWLVEYAALSQPAAMRIAAIDGLKKLLQVTGGRSDPAVAAVLGDALTARDPELLGEALQAAFEIEAPLPLSALADLLTDRRPLFMDFAIADNAMWILCKQLGLQVVAHEGNPAEERCDAAAAELLRDYLRRHDGKLEWSTKLSRYRLAD